MGATVEVLSETPGVSLTQHLLTNSLGEFRGDKLAPGFYTVRVTLAGFLPTLDKHVLVSANLTTVVRIQLESMFASLEQMRRPPTNAAVEADDWKWALRSASGLRPVLQWDDDNSNISSGIVLENAAARPHGRLELMDGARQPGSISNIGEAPASAFAYDERIDNTNHIVFAGQVSYDEDSPSGGFAAIWLPNGSPQNGPASTIVLREARIGADGPIFTRFGLIRVARLPSEIDSCCGLAVNMSSGITESAWSVRPRLNLQTKISPNWYVDLIYASVPNSATAGEALAADLNDAQIPNVLQTALNQLDAFPTMLWRNGQPRSWRMGNTQRFPWNAKWVHTARCRSPGSMIMTGIPRSMAAEAINFLRTTSRTSILVALPTMAAPSMIGVRELPCEKELAKTWS